MKQNTLKSVMNKLSSQKVELEQHKIELSLASQISNYADDIRTVQSKLQQLDVAESKVSRLFAIKEDAIQLSKELKSVRAEEDERYVSTWVNDTPKLLNELEQSTKQLGIDPSQVKGYSELKKSLASISSKYKDIQGIGAKVERELGRRI